MKPELVEVLTLLFQEVERLSDQIERLEVEADLFSGPGLQGFVRIRECLEVLKALEAPKA